MRFAVFIASHIHYDNQIKLLEKAIISIKNQNYKNENIYIWLSISFSSIEYANDFDEMNIAKECFKCFKHDKQMYQLEHLRYLNEQTYNYYIYDWICFLDDDDEYSKGRIKAFKTKAHMIKDKNKNTYLKTQVIYEKRRCIVGNNNEVLKCYIYWLYAVKQNALNVFFKWFSITSLQNNNADFLLKMYLERLFLINKNATIENNYYLYNTENRNGILKNEKNTDIYYAIAMNDKEFLTEKYGKKYKKEIDIVLYNECKKYYHNFKYIWNTDEVVRFLLKNIIEYSS